MKKCHVCEEEYEILHLCNVELILKKYGIREKSMKKFFIPQSFDSWFASIEHYIERSFK